MRRRDHSGYTASQNFRHSSYRGPIYEKEDHYIDEDLNLSGARRREDHDISIGHLGKLTGNNYFNLSEEDLEPGPHFGKGPKNWRRSDERITEDVNEALYQSQDVDASDIEVSVSEGCVYLRGTVESRRAKRDAEEAVENILGVVDVQNELRVHREFPELPGVPS